MANTAATPATASVSSLYRHSRLTQKEDGSVFFTLPERVSFDDQDDVTTHIANGQEFLWDIAQQYYKRVYVSPLDLWEVLMQFQPEPIQDPSVPVPLGQEVYIPSLEWIEEVAFGQSLADVPEL